MSAITELKGLKLTLSLQILRVKISKQRPKMTVISIVSPMIKVMNTHLTCRGTIWKIQAKPNSSCDLIASTIRKSAEVTLR